MSNIEKLIETTREVDRYYPLACEAEKEYHRLRSDLSEAAHIARERDYHLQQAIEREAAIRSDIDVMASRVVRMCKARGWSMHWTHRGAYLHLESSELIEAVRGKHGEPADEAGDVLLVLMSITEYQGIPFSDVLAKAEKKLAYLEVAPRYSGEETSGGSGGEMEGRP